MRPPFAVLILLPILAACAAPSPLPPAPFRPAGADPVPAAGRGPDVEEPDGPLTLRTALALALLRSPDLSAASFDLRAAEARRIQAGVLPNPEVAWTLENTGGSLGGEAESTVLLSQLVELGGKRSARMAVADGGAALAGWDQETGRLDVLADTALDFVAVLGAQSGVVVAGEALEIAKEVLEATRARAEAGAVSPTEVRRAEVEVAVAEVGRDRAAAALEGARARLAANWSDGPPRFTTAAGDLPLPGVVPSLDSLLPLLERNPDLARKDAEIALGQAELDAAKAGRIPDLTVGAGRRRFDGTGDHAYVFEVSVPLPLFDRGRGAVLEAEARLSAARMRRNASAQSLRARLAGARAGLEAAGREEAALRERIVPWARELLEATRERYRAGRVGQLDLLDARRTFAEAAARQGQALAEAHAQRIEIERLLAGPMESVPSGDPQ